MYTPSPQGQVVSMRVVNNSTVMTPNVISQPGAPAVMTTVPQPVSTSMPGQPPVSTHAQNGKSRNPDISKDFLKTKIKLCR